MAKEKFKDRRFMILLYPDNKEHDKAYEYIRKNYDFASILHDKDYEEDGITLKKEHWHIVIRIDGKNQRWSTAIAEEIGIEHRFIDDKIKNLDRALEYLIHYNEDNKHIYDIDEVKGSSLKERLKQNLTQTDKTEGEKVIEIIEIIENSHILKMSDLAKNCASSGMWSEFRRAGGIFAQILKEHNEEIQKIIEKE